MTLNLAFLLLQKPEPWLNYMCMYLTVTGGHLVEARCVTEEEVQRVTDALRMFFPYGIVLQAGRNEKVEAVHYRPFTKPCMLRSHTHRLPLILVHARKSVIVGVGWLVPQ